MKENLVKFLAAGLIVFFAIISDQVTKFWAEDNLASPYYPEHTISITVNDTAETPDLTALINKKYAQNSDDENMRIMANARRNGARINPQDKLNNGDTVELSYVKLTVIDGYYDYQYARNPGAAFSFLADKPDTFRSIFFGITGLLAVILILVFILKSAWKNQKVMIISLACILGGAVGNIIDRVRLSYVIDFISWHVGPHTWPTFNIADVFVTGGVAFLILDMIIKSIIEKKNGKKSSDEKSKDNDVNDQASAA